MFSRQTLLVIFIFVSTGTSALSVVSKCLKGPSKNESCSCEKGFTNLGSKCLSQWLVIGIFSGVVLLLIIIVLILGCCLAKARKTNKQPVPVADCISREDRSTSTSGMPSNETKDASTDTEGREAPIMTKVPMLGAPFSYTNSSFVGNEKSYIPDFMKRRNYDQSTFEEVPLQDGRRMDRSNGDVLGAPFSYTNNSFENNEKSYIPDFMKRRNYDQSTFDEIPRQDGRRMDRSNGDVLGAPFSKTNNSFENNEKSYIPDFMKRNNDQSTFEEVPLQDGRRVDKSSGDDSKMIFSIKRPIQRYYSKASDKDFQRN